MKRLIVHAFIPLVLALGAASAAERVAVDVGPSPRGVGGQILLAGRTAGERSLVEVAAGVCIPFRWCPPGTFKMGSPASEHAVLRAAGMEEKSFYVDEVEHQVTLTKGFWMAETEVTQAQWQAVMGTTLLQQTKCALMDDTLYDMGGKKQTWRDWAGVAKETDPATIIGVRSGEVAMYFVNWEEAARFCTKASRHAALRGWVITLPTEAQWEYACRAGTQGMTYAGDFAIIGQMNAPGLDAIAWYGGNSSQGYTGRGWDTGSWNEKQFPGGCAGPRRVAMKRANEWGLYDMIGNVWEWCSDYYGSYAPGSATDPTGASSGTCRVSRGGSWIGIAALCRAAYRDWVVPGRRVFSLGFRPALVPSS